MARDPIRFVLLLLAALAMGGVGSAAAKVRVVTTLPDLAAIVSEVGGDHVQVTALASPRQDPHYVDAKPSLLVPLSRADLFIINGVELEVGWVPPLQVGSRNPRIQRGQPGFFEAAEHVTLMGVEQGRVDRSMGDVHPGGNPHFTFDPRAAAQLATALGERLGRIDPANAVRFRSNAARFVESLRALTEAERARFHALATERRRVVSYHDSLPYLFDWLGITAVEHVEPRPGVPPDPGHVARVLAVIKKQNARAIVQEEYYPAKTSKTLARLGGAQMVVLPGNTRFASGEAYIDHIKAVTEALYVALSR